MRHRDCADKQESCLEGCYGNSGKSEAHQEPARLAEFGNNPDTEDGHGLALIQGRRACALRGCGDGRSFDGRRRLAGRSISKDLARRTRKGKLGHRLHRKKKISVP
jgi:hypothetical protein